MSSFLSLLLLYIKIFFVKISIIFSLLLIEFNTYINISKEYSPILAIIVFINSSFLIYIVLSPIILKSVFISSLKLVHVSILKVLIFFDIQPTTIDIASLLYLSGGNNLKNNPKSLISLIFSAKLFRY